MTTRLSDTDLVRGVTRKEENCFEELLERYSSKVLNLALRITRNQEDSEEILQDVFITVFTKVVNFEHKAAFLLIHAPFRKSIRACTITPKNLCFLSRSTVLKSEFSGLR